MRLSSYQAWPWITLSGATMLAACQPGQETKQPASEPANGVAERSPLPLAEPPMDRAGLLDAVAVAASAAALGLGKPAPQQALDGRRFEVRIRFACAGPQGPAAAAGPFKLRFNQDDRTLRVRAEPDLTNDDAWIAALAGRPVEAVEGFWMYRPWLRADGCPVSSPDAPAAEAGPRPLPGQRVGIAQFFTDTDPRTARRDGRAFEATTLLEGDERPSAQGYNLVLSGRLRQLPGGRVIHCRATGRDSPPECVVSAQFDRVRIERPDSRQVLAEWAG